jgi:NADPH:quinone reductase-like Zn-dependent oxidoreductase
MRAVGLMTHGGPEVLQVVEVDEVQAGPGQVRIRNYAAAVNPTDIVARDGTRAKGTTSVSAAVGAWNGRRGHRRSGW